MELSKKIYDKQFTTVTTHKNVQNYCNEKCVKYLMFDLKKYREVIFHDTEGWFQISNKLTCGLENDMRNMANFYQSNLKSQNWDDGIL